VSPEERRKEIILAALKVFERDGFHKAKVSDIAKAANIGKGTIYEYFSSKKDLFEEMAKYCINQYITETKEYIDREASPIEKLKRYIEIEREVMDKYGNIANIIFQEVDKICNEVRNIIIAARNKKISLLEKILEDGIREGIFRRVNPYTFAVLFMGGTHQLVADELLFNKSDEPSSFNQEDLIDILLKGISK